ncbi:hypothetical protein MPER_01386, partial [Moniliophthora perniciosa FA553]
NNSVITPQLDLVKSNLLCVKARTLGDVIIGLRIENSCFAASNVTKGQAHLLPTFPGLGITPEGTKEPEHGY